MKSLYRIFDKTGRLLYIGERYQLARHGEVLENDWSGSDAIAITEDGMLFVFFPEGSCDMTVETVRNRRFRTVKARAIAREQPHFNLQGAFGAVEDRLILSLSLEKVERGGPVGAFAMWGDQPSSYAIALLAKEIHARKAAYTRA